MRVRLFLRTENKAANIAVNPLEYGSSITVAAIEVKAAKLI